MASYQDMNTATRLIAEGIEHRVAQQVEDLIVAKMVEEFETNAREIVRAEANKITVESVRSFLDATKMSEEIKIHMKWSDENEMD